MTSPHIGAIFNRRPLGMIAAPCMQTIKCKLVQNGACEMKQTADDVCAQ